MIEQEIIENLSRKYQTASANVWREYFQHLFLHYLYQQKGSEKLYFKGGTALRIIYHSPRFSEDLDFSASFYGAREIEPILIGALSEIEREGIKTKLDEAKSTTGGYLARMQFRANGRMIATKIEISQRAGKKEGEVVTVVGDFIPPYEIVRLDEKILIGEKIQALLGRHKPRDFYDLYFLLRANLITADQKQDLLPKALELIQGSKIDFRQELKQFLPKSHWLIIRDFQKTLEQEIKRAF